MIVTVNVVVNIPALDAWLKIQSSTLNDTLARVEAKLDAASILEKIMALNVEALTAAVTRETTVDNSILVLVQGLAANQTALSKQLADAIAANDPAALAAVQQAIDASATTMTANADRLAAAVTANTPPVVP